MDISGLITANVVSSTGTIKAARFCWLLVLANAIMDRFTSGFSASTTDSDRWCCGGIKRATPSD